MNKPQVSARPRARRTVVAQTEAATLAGEVSVRATEPNTAPAIPLSLSAERAPKIPSVYADAVQDVIYGVHTTKVLLAEEVGHAADLRPVVMVTIPTEALVLACVRILENMSSEEIVSHIDTRQRLFSKQLKSLRKGAKSPG